MNIQLISLTNEKNMRKRLVEISFLTLLLIFMNLGVITPINAVSSVDMKLEIEWEVFFGGTEDDIPLALVQTVDGGFAVLISTDDSTTRDEISSSLVKFTANGQQEWNTTFEAIDSWKRNNLIQTADERYVIASRIGVFGEDSDIQLFKMNSMGYLDWNRTFGGEKSDWANSIILTEDGGFALAGGYNYDAQAPGELWRDYDMWLVKTDSLGIPEWNRTFGGEFSDLASPVIQTSDGGYAIAGRTDSYGQGMGNDEAWLVKTDANGIEEWNQTYGWGMVLSMIQISDGSYILGGGESNYYLLKTDSNGNLVWHHYYDNYYTDIFNCLIQTNDGGYLLAGSTGATYESTHDLWFVKTDVNGIHEWNVTYTALPMVVDQRLSSVIQLSDESLVIAGTYGSEAWLFKAQVVEDTSTTTTPGFELGVLILNLSLLFLILRKQRQ